MRLSAPAVNDYLNAFRSNPAHTGGNDTLKGNMAAKWLVISVAAAVGVGIVAISVHRKGPAIAPPRKASAAQPESTLSGEMRPRHVIAVDPAMDGEIDAFLVEVGDDVSVGQVLARIRPSKAESQRAATAAALGEAQAQAARAEQSIAAFRMEAANAEARQTRAHAQLESQRVNYERQDLLNQSKATPRLTWEKAQHEYQLAQQDAELADKAAQFAADQVQAAENTRDVAQKNLKDRTRQSQAETSDTGLVEIRSPAAGTVMERTGEAGKPAGPGLFAIANDRIAWEVSLPVTPELVQRIRPSQEAVVQLPAAQGASIRGHVREIKTGSVVVEFDCPLPTARPGMRVDVRFKFE
jgi:multidrug resistance efflux pump